MASSVAAAGLAAPCLSPFLHSSIACYPRTPSPLIFIRRRLGVSRRGGFLRAKPQPVPDPRFNPVGSAHDDAGTGGLEGSEELSRATLLWRAIKLPIYSVALVPLTVGSTAAYLQTGLFFARRYLVLLTASFLVMAWLNLSNDVYDFDTGADSNKKESLVNLTGSRIAMHFAAYALLAFGFTGLIWASAESGDIRSILLLACAILCGYVYQCPPFRLSYQGLGEPLCFMAFGPFATTAFYFSQSNNRSISEMFHLPLTGVVVSSSLLVGLTTSLILFCSHFHQTDGDRAVGKMSPLVLFPPVGLTFSHGELVRIGTKTGSEVVKAAVSTLYFLLLALSIGKALPLTCFFLCILTIPVGKSVVDFVKENHSDKHKIFMAKYYCLHLNALFGAALAAGLVLARTTTKVQLPWVFLS